MSEHESWAIYMGIDLASHLFIAIVGETDPGL